MSASRSYRPRTHTACVTGSYPFLRTFDVSTFDVSTFEYDPEQTPSPTASVQTPASYSVNTSGSPTSLRSSLRSSQHVLERPLDLVIPDTRSTFFVRCVALPPSQDSSAPRIVMSTTHANVGAVSATDLVVCEVKSGPGDSSEQSSPVAPAEPAAHRRYSNSSTTSTGSSTSTTSSTASSGPADISLSLLRKFRLVHRKRIWGLDAVRSTGSTGPTMNEDLIISADDAGIGAVWALSRGKIGLLPEMPTVTYCVRGISEWRGRGGEVLLAGYGDFGIRRYDMTTLKRSQSFLGHESKVMGVVPHLPTNSIFSCDQTECLLRWDPRTAESTASVEMREDGVCIDAMQDDHVLLVGQNQAVETWDIRNLSTHLLRFRAGIIHTFDMARVAMASDVYVSVSGTWVGEGGGAGSRSAYVAAWHARSGKVRQRYNMRALHSYGVAVVRMEDGGAAEWDHGPACFGPEDRDSGAQDPVCPAGYLPASGGTSDPSLPEEDLTPDGLLAPPGQSKEATRRLARRQQMRLRQQRQARIQKEQQDEFATPEFPSSLRVAMPQPIGSEAESPIEMDSGSMKEELRRQVQEFERRRQTRSRSAGGPASSGGASIDIDSTNSPVSPPAVRRSHVADDDDPRSTTSSDSDWTLRALLDYLHLGKYFEVFDEEEIEFEDLKRVVEDAVFIEELIPRPVPRERLVRFVAARGDHFRVKPPSKIRQAMARQGAAEMGELLKKKAMTKYVSKFAEQEIILADAKSLGDYVNELITRRAPKARFLSAVEALDLVDPAEFSGSGSSRSQEGGGGGDGHGHADIGPSPGTARPARVRAELRGMDRFLTGSHCVPPPEINFLRWDSVKNLTSVFAMGAFGMLRRGAFEGMKVVVKDILLRSRSLFAMAVEEVNHLLMFQHEKVVRVYGYSFKDESVPKFRIVMEAMRTSLRSVVSFLDPVDDFASDDDREFSRVSKMMTLEQKFRMMWQCALVLKYLHGRNTMHRDVKAENFLVSGNLDPQSPSFDICVKIADFGLAKAKRTDATQSKLTATRGTMFWMAPEVVPGSGSAASDVTYGFGADIYSLACTFYEVLYGVTPFCSCDDPLSGEVTSYNIQSYVRAGRRPCCVRLREYCPEFASFLERLWARPILPEFDTMTKVIGWFEAHEDIFAENYSLTVFNDLVGGLDVRQPKSSSFLDSEFV